MRIVHRWKAYRVGMIGVLRGVVLLSLVLGSLLSPSLLRAEDGNAPVTVTAPEPPPNVPLRQTPDGCGVRTINVTISLYRAAPAGSAIRRTYEQAIRYFADGVYESSNCAHQLGKVSIYQRGKAKDTADIVWVRKVHPAAIPSGYRREGGNVSMGDVYNEEDQTTLGDQGQRNMGYTLAHEWGHIYYSLFDEYQGGDPLDREAIWQPANSDKPISPSLMNNPDAAFEPDDPDRYAWLNFSANFDYENIPFNRTAHGRIYATSNWGTLVRRPAQDPATARDETYPRFYYPELRNFAPDNETLFDLPEATFNAVNQAGNPARAKLRIVWYNTDIARLFVVNTANASGGNQLESIFEALAQEIDNTEDNASIGVIGFDSTARVVVPMTRLTDDTARKTVIEQLAENLTTGTGTTGNVQAALDLAAATLAAYPTYADGSDVGSIFLLSGAPLSNGDNLDASLLPYQDDDVPIYTFGIEVSLEDDELLLGIADATAGLHAFVMSVQDPYDDIYAFDSTVSELVDALLDAALDADPTVETLLDEGEERIAATRTYVSNFAVDDTLTSIEVLASVSPTATLTLRDPNRQDIAPNDCFSDDPQAAVPTFYCFFALTDPITGNWQLRATAGDTRADLFYTITGAPGEDNSTFTVDVAIIPDNTVRYPEPIIVQASVSDELKISGLGVTGTLVLPNGERRPFPLFDDGIAPDGVPSDGFYTGLITNYPADGNYQITVQLDNKAGTGATTYEGKATAPGKRDPVTGLPLFPPPPPQPVITDFVRLARTNVLVNGVRPDDHSNAAASATSLTSENTAVFGKIDVAGDQDYFRVTIPTTFTGNLTVRVANLLDGMQPRLRVFGADGTSLITETLLTAGNTSGYILATVPATPGSSIVAAVDHINTAAARGNYTIAAGESLPSEGIFLNSLRATPASVPADGQSTATISATVLLDGLAAADQPVTLTTSLGTFTNGNTSTVVIPTNTNGFLTATLTSALMGTATISASAGTNTLTDTVRFSEAPARRIYLPIVIRAATTR